MRDLDDEGSGSEEGNFQSRTKNARRGTGTANGNEKASKTAAAEEEGPA